MWVGLQHSAGSLKLIINTRAIDMIWISVLNPDMPSMYMLFIQIGNKTGNSDGGLGWKNSLTVWSARGWTNAAWHKKNAEMLPNVQLKSG